MSDSSNALLARVRAGLSWPEWSTWADSTHQPPLPVDVVPTDHATRSAAVEHRLSLARLVADGGPYLDVFFAAAMQRLDDEHGTDLGPLRDFTFAIKDLFAIEERRLGAGSAVRADAAVEQATAPIITMLESQGAVALGTVTLHEFAFGVTGINPSVGTAPNPQSTDRIPGGSSSGSACAVADGSARIALGTDTGGSVRIPASFCGVVGYKPSFGLYPSAGVFPLSGTLDHVGLFAANVGDVITTHRALGHGCDEPRLPSRVGIARGDIEAADADVQTLIEEAIERLQAAGCDLIDVGWPDAEKTFVASTAIMFAEAAAVHSSMLAEHGDRYGTDIRARLELGASLTSAEVATALELRRQLQDEVRATLANVDVIIGPTTPMVAPPIADADDPALAPRVVANTRLGNVVGLPAISLPLATDGPPAGLQVLGPADNSLLASARSIEDHLH